MVAWYRPNVISSGSAGGVNINGGERFWAFAWIPTARNADFQVGGPRGIVTDDATRTATKCFMRGLKEKIRIETTSSHFWLWRRICFKFVGTELLTDNEGTAYNLWEETSAGFVRATTQINPSIEPSLDLWNKLVSLMFKGQANIDWSELMTAPLDQSRIKVAYDRTRRIKSENEVGTLRTFTEWHPMNKTLIYNDDEEGGGKTASFLSVNNRQSMGDYYVIDLFDAGITGGGDDELIFTPEATLYWHER